ncbi:MAG: hypothetical protein IKT31_05930, partial [Firmicutes bacterium]|nr:hypothetical protein [Bacillota bacterium]
MAKINLKKIREAASGKKGLVDCIFLLAAAVIDGADEILDELGEMGADGEEFIFELGADFVSIADKTADIVAWLISKTVILLLRQVHDMRMALNVYRREITKFGIIGLMTATLIIGLYSWVTDYEYAYNGRIL